MGKCIRCSKNNGVYNVFDGGKVCDSCLGSYFTCPKCGNIYRTDDLENSDGGNGFCVKCTKEEN